MFFLFSFFFCLGIMTSQKPEEKDDGIAEAPSGHLGVKMEFYFSQNTFFLILTK